MQKINPDNINRADILLVHTKYSITSKIIRKFTKSYWNHCGIFVSKDHQWPKWIIESTKNSGVVGTPFELKYLKVLRNDNGSIINIKASRKYEISIIRVKNLTYQQKKEISDKAYHWAIEERKYDYLLLIVGMILHIITFRKIYPNILNSESKFICSELIASAFYKITGINFSKLSSVGYVTPGDIADFAKTSENAEIVFKS